jgi:hypothetical protein
MPDRDNEQYLCLLEIDQSVWETPKHIAPISCGELRRRTRMIANQARGAPELCDEL